jgi:hypothetical protein
MEKEVASCYRILNLTSDFYDVQFRELAGNKGFISASTAKETEITEEDIDNVINATNEEAAI